MGKGFENGHMKMGGREKGTRNKSTEIKNFFRDFVIDNQEEFKKAFLKLKDKDKCAVYLKASEFVVPKVSSIKFEDAKNTNSAVELLKVAASYKNGNKK